MRLPFLRRRRAALARLLVGIVLLGIPAAMPLPAVGAGPLPECHLDDVLTEPRGYDDWAITQVDWVLTLGRRYRPPDLVSVGQADIEGGGYVRAVAIDDLRAMAAAARENGTPIKVLSPFRGYRQQVELFRSYAGWTGSGFTNFDNAITFSARPGHSEHQTGLTIDFGSSGDTVLNGQWHQTPAGAWMAENAWKYGWLMSYPKGKKDVVCYRFEPWHYRYVGRDLAAAIQESGLTIREYLWIHHTRVDGACMAEAPSDLETPGKPRSCPLAEPAPSAGSTDPPASNGPEPTSGPATSPPAPSVDPSPGPGDPTPAPTSPGGVGFLSEVPVLAGLALALAAIVLVALGAWRRTSRR